MIDISVSNLVKEFEVGNKILNGLTFQVDTGSGWVLLQDGCDTDLITEFLHLVADI